jgi:hypothetical protein
MIDAIYIDKGYQMSFEDANPKKQARTPKHSKATV